MQILDSFSKLPAYRDVLAGLQVSPGSTELLAGLGLPRSARLPLVARLSQDLRRPILLITNRADRALALYEELQFWLGERGVHYFPEPNPLFYEKSGWGLGTRRDRLQVMTLLARTLMPGVPDPEQPPVIVAPVRAIMTRTLPRRDFIKHTKAFEARSAGHTRGIDPGVGGYRLYLCQHCG
jgi:transcription-repair coupling factor (superfamily II helicase)